MGHHIFHYLLKYVGVIMRVDIIYTRWLLYISSSAIQADVTNDYVLGIYDYLLFILI
jgi:hypothetical protein